MCPEFRRAEILIRQLPVSGTAMAQLVRQQAMQFRPCSLLAAAAAVVVVDVAAAVTTAAASPSSCPQALPRQPPIRSIGWEGCAVTEAPKEQQPRRSTYSSEWTLTGGALEAERPPQPTSWLLQQTPGPGSTGHCLRRFAVPAVAGAGVAAAGEIPADTGGSAPCIAMPDSGTVQATSKWT